MAKHVTTRETQTVWRTIFWVYIVGLVVVVIFKGLPNLPELWAERSSLDWVPRYNLTPFDTLKRYLNNYAHPVHLRNIWGNILPFIPMGLLMPFAFSALCGFFRTSGLCFLLITLMEVIQLVTGLGSFDVDDILLNTLSCMLGYVLYALFSLPQRRKNKKKYTV